ncbi:hypothetical protein D3C80_563620 [compost metagenome]
MSMAPSDTMSSTGKARAKSMATLPCVPLAKRAAKPRAAYASRFNPFVSPFVTVSAPEFRSGRKPAFRRIVTRFG